MTMQVGEMPSRNRNVCAFGTDADFSDDYYVGPEFAAWDPRPGETK